MLPFGNLLHGAETLVFLAEECKKSPKMKKSCQEEPVTAKLGDRHPSPVTGEGLH